MDTDRKKIDTLTEEVLAGSCKTRWLGKHFFCYEEIDSTNMEAKRLAEDGGFSEKTAGQGADRGSLTEAGAPHGTVVVADRQTAGRGRRGRQWTSEAGMGIWFSMILKPDFSPEKASALTLVAALAVAKAILRIARLPPQIKWPNDIVLNGKKLCGILTEMSANVDKINHIIVGIGINVEKQDFSGEYADHATALRSEGAKPFSRPELLAAVLEEFERYYAMYLDTLDLGPMLAEYNAFLVNRDRPVKVLDPAGDYEGVARGVNRRGELLVERDGELIPVSSGEVSVRGIYGYV